MIKTERWFEIVTKKVLIRMFPRSRRTECPLKSQILLRFIIYVHYMFEDRDPKKKKNVVTVSLNIKTKVIHTGSRIKRRNTSNSQRTIQ